VISFAVTSIERTRKEKEVIEKMWSRETTIKGLREKALVGEPLPDVVLVRGFLDSTGPSVKPVTPTVPQLVPLLGQIDQPDNLFLTLADHVKQGNIKMPKDVSIDHSDINIKNEELLQRDGNMKSASSDNLVITELLITRLGCEATKRTRRKKKGKRYTQEVVINRTPRSARE